MGTWKLPMASVASLWPWARTTPGRESGAAGGGIAEPSKKWDCGTLLGRWNDLTISPPLQGLAGSSRALAELSGTCQHDHVLHRHPWPLSCQ